MMMDLLTELACVLGGLLMIFGACVVFIGLVAAIKDWIASIWIDGSNKWRAICSTESLIHEYKKNREDYLRWKESFNGK